jgi:hypothetical protein
MNSDNVNYALSFLSFIPYSKATAKSVLLHSASLSVGLVAFLTSKTMKGEAVMRPNEWFDYVLVHPFALPLWLWAYVYMFFAVSGHGWLMMLIPLLFFAIWLRQWQESLARILEAQSVKNCGE